MNNMGGLGFNGYDENGKAKWNRVTNVNILKVEVILCVLILTYNLQHITAGFLRFILSPVARRGR